MADNDFKKGLDFQGDKKKLFDSIYQMSEDFRADYDRDCNDSYRLYHSYVNLDNRDLRLLHPFVPKSFTMIQRLSADDIKSMLGSKPYFPLDPVFDAWRGNTEAMELLSDYYADQHGFFSKGAKFTKMTRLFGTTVVEPFWRYEIRYKTISSGETKGYIVNKGKSTKVAYVYEGLDWRVHSPWMTGVDPATEVIRDMRWIYVKQHMSWQELQGLMKFGKYRKKFEDLTEVADYSPLGKDMRAEIGYQEGDDSKNMGTLVRVWLPRENQYFEMWNGEDLIRDIPNPYTFVPLIRFYNITDALAQSFYGISEIKPTAQLQHMLNDAYGNLMNAQAMSTNPILYYPEGIIDPNVMVASPGAKVPYDASRMEEITRGAIFPLKIPPPTSDAYEIPDRLDQVMDNTGGQNPYREGSQASRKETAFAVRKIMEGSEARVEAKLRETELASLMPLALMNLRIIEKNIPESEKERILGDKARFYVYGDPDQLPGGYEFRFQGSNLIADQRAKLEDMMNLTNIAPEEARSEIFQIMIEKGNIFTHEEVQRVKAKLQAPPPMPMEGQGGTPPNPRQMVNEQPPVTPPGAMNVTGGNPL